MQPDIDVTILSDASPLDTLVGLEAIASRFEAIPISLEAIAISLEALPIHLFSNTKTPGLNLIEARIQLLHAFVRHGLRTDATGPRPSASAGEGGEGPAQDRLGQY